MRGPLDARPFHLIKDSPPLIAIGHLFHKFQRVSEFRFIAKAEFLRHLLFPAVDYSTRLGFSAEADGVKPERTGIEWETIWQQISRRLCGANEALIPLRKPGGIAQLMDKLGFASTWAAGPIALKNSLQNALIL